MSDNFSRRSAVHLRRMELLDVAIKYERAMRGSVNFLSFVAAMVFVAVYWRSFDVRWMLGTVIGLVVVRAIGNGFVTLWCDRELRRIKAAHPLPDDEVDDG